MSVSNHTCVYLNCNKSRKTSPTHHFFKFPVIKDKQRSDKWIANCGNKNLFTISDERLATLIICQDHFFPTSFHNSDRNRLIHNAVPIHYSTVNLTSSVCSTNITPKVMTLPPVKRKLFDSECEIKEKNRKTYSTESLEVMKENYLECCDLYHEHAFSSPEKPSKAETETSLGQEYLNMPSPNAKMPTFSPRKSKLKKALANKRSQICRLKKKSSLSSYELVKKIVSNFSLDKQCFILMQCFHRKGQGWSKDEKNLALSLYYKSSSAYKYMRNELKLTLPAISTIRSWLKVGNLRTGLDTTFFKKLKQKVSVMSTSEKECVLMFDEMSIRRGLQYNATYDFVEGYEDLGTHGRSSKLGNQAMVFMARGLINRWKIPVAYYIAGGSLDSIKLKSILSEVVRKLQDIGLKVRAVVCDQQSTNRATYKNLGVTINNPYFEIDGRKVYAIYDVPHLIKSFRNILMKHDIYDGTTQTSWKDIEQTYIIDKNCESARSLCKITYQHIYPNSFQKMKVKLATQVFSKRMAATIRTVVVTNELKSVTALNTVSFLEKVNDLFDSLNSRRAHDSNPSSCGLSSNKCIPRKILENAVTWIPTLKVYTEKGKENNKIYCFNGLLQTVNAVLSLSSDIEMEEYKFLLTSRLNQDPIENLFSALRHRNGSNDNPTPAQFRVALQHNIFIRLLSRPDDPNCEDDLDDNITLEVISEDETTADAANADQVYETETEESENILEERENVVCENASPSRNENTTLEVCAVTYVAGYLALKCKKKFNCSQCMKDITTKENLKENRNLLILYRDYSIDKVEPHLQVPTENFLNVVELELKVFVKLFDDIKISTNIKGGLRRAIMEQINRIFPEWLDNKHSCYNHRMYMLNFLLHIKMLFHLKTESRNYQIPKKRKIKILQHK